MEGATAQSRTAAVWCAMASWKVCIWLLVASCSAQRISFGKCPTLRGMVGFDIKKMEGKWYEVERSFYVYEIASSCTSLFFAPKANGSIKVAVKSVSRITGNPSISLGTATPIRNGSSTLSYKSNSRLPAAVARMMPGVGQYTLLHTDYDNYALLWSCSDLTLMHADLIWVLGRKRELPVWARAEVYNKLAEFDIDSDRLTLSRQRNCPTF